MDINITAIERNLRLYGRPAAIMAFGLLVMLLVELMPEGSGALAMVGALRPWAGLLAAGVCLWGACWLGYEAWREWRWERGALDGGCLNCGGPMRHMTGRYGDYSKCHICGQKRGGHH